MADIDKTSEIYQVPDSNLSGTEQDNNKTKSKTGSEESSTKTQLFGKSSALLLPRPKAKPFIFICSAS